MMTDWHLLPRYWIGQSSVQVYRAIKRGRMTFGYILSVFDATQMYRDFDMSEEPGSWIVYIAFSRLSFG